MMIGQIPKVSKLPTIPIGRECGCNFECGLFKKYFIGSPMLSWDNYSVYKFDHTRNLSGGLDTVNVYISWGQLESKEGKHHPLKDTLEKRNNPHISFISELLEGETHLSGIGLAYSRAFRRLYGGK